MVQMRRWRHEEVRQALEQSHTHSQPVRLHRGGGPDGLVPESAPSGRVASRGGGFIVSSWLAPAPPPQRPSPASVPGTAPASVPPVRTQVPVLQPAVGTFPGRRRGIPGISDRQSHGRERMAFCSTSFQTGDLPQAWSRERALPEAEEGTGGHFRDPCGAPSGEVEWHGGHTPMVLGDPQAAPQPGTEAWAAGRVGTAA